MNSDDLQPPKSDDEIFDISDFAKDKPPRRGASRKYFPASSPQGWIMELTDVRKQTTKKGDLLEYTAQMLEGGMMHGLDGKITFFLWFEDHKLRYISRQKFADLKYVLELPEADDARLLLKKKFRAVVEKKKLPDGTFDKDITYVTRFFTVDAFDVPGKGAGTLIKDGEVVQQGNQPKELVDALLADGGKKMIEDDDVPF